MDQIFEKLDFIKITDRIARYTTSNFGKEKVDSIKFEIDPQIISYNLDILCEFKQLLEVDEAFPIEGIKDIRESLIRSSIENSCIQPKEFLDILSTLKASRRIKSYFTKRKDKYPHLFSLVENLYFDKIFEFNIEKTIDDNGNVKDSASKSLKEIRQKIINLTGILTKELEKILKRLSEQQYTQDDLITQRDDRFVIPIKVEHKRHIPGFIHSASSSGATVFIEPAETLELNNDITSLHFEERREIERILKELTNQVRVNYMGLRETVKILGEVDFLAAKANYAIEIIGSKPVINLKGSIKIHNGYHPILLQKHKRSEVVPLNFNIGLDFNTLIITGPNAGGKSVALKTIGILILMLQSGLLIPASPDSDFRIFSKMFIDIGDEQSIENDLSTFSSHLLHLKYIAENSDSNSIILIDEIGEGTDPIEGGAIAASVLLNLTKRGAFTIATTHQSSLKVFAYQSEGIENGAMEFDQKTITPTYYYREGIPGSSYALEIAQRLGLPGDIISYAKEFIGEDKNNLEKIISDLDNKLQTYSTELKSVIAEREKLKELINSAQQKSKELDKEKKMIKSTALKEAESFIFEMNAKVEKVIREIRESEASKEAIKQSKEILHNIKEEYKLVKQNFKLNHDKELEYKVGERIKLKEGNERGLIEKIDIVKKIATINFGNLKIDAPLEDLERIETNETEVVNNRSYYNSLIEQKNFQIELDLRGKYGAEALPIIDKFLDDAYLKGLNRVDIIHGKGTGALRKKITEYLREHHYVKSFRLGEWNEGGSGVTVVEINSNA